MAYVLLYDTNLKDWTVDENRIIRRLGETVKGEDRFSVNKGSKKTKDRVTERWEVYAVCQRKESKLSVFVLHQWVMAAIIPPNGH